jgi:hypothetical protein
MNVVRALLLILILSAPAVAQEQTSTRAGRRPLLPRDQEVALARSAAPPSISTHARVFVLTDTGFVLAEPGPPGGDSQVACVVGRSWRHSLEPHCFDAEGAATVLPLELRRTTMRHLGHSEEEIEGELAAGLASGRFRLPSRPAMTYMMSEAQILYNDDGRRVGAWRPHLMIYYPYLTDASVGLPSTPEMQVGMVTQPGTPGSSLMILLPQFVKAAAGIPSR